MGIGTNLTLSVILLVVFACDSLADNYPSKPIRIIVPVSVGSPADLRTREIAALMTQQLGKAVFVENKPGAGATIGASYVARAQPDGYTILYAFNGPMAIAPHVLKAPGYDALKDFAPIIRIGSQTMVLVVPAVSPFTSVKALVEHAKANPGKLLYGSSGVGSVGHIPAEMLKRAAGNLDIVHVPYKGDNEVAQELMNARLSMAFATPGTTLPQIKAGKFRALAVTSKVRSPALPDVPTMREAGFLDFEWNNWIGYVAPAGTPTAIIEKLHREIAIAVNSPAFKARQEAQLVELAADQPEVFAAWIAREHARIGKLVHEIGLEPQ